MEEKDYKKLYEDTVALAKDGLKDGLYLSQSAKAVTEFLFPQLKETEDEKVKRELTRFLINFNNGYYSKPSETQIDSWVKWVDKKCGKKPVECIKFDNEFENQISHLIASVLNDEHEYNEGFVKYASQSLLGFANKDQKHTDKVEPKFKISKFTVGDWVVNNRDDSSREIIQVYGIRDGRYYFNDNIHFSWSVKECDEKCHLWTIQDAKDGDVLQLGNVIAIFKKTIEGSYNYCYCHCSICNNEFDIPEDTEEYGCCNAVPATKEQCDLLFQKMYEDGYEWSAEKKKLRKVEQKPSWGEEDEEKCMWLVRLISTAGFRELENDKMPCSRLELLDWLKSINTQPKQEWSEEDDKYSSYICAALQCYYRLREDRNNTNGQEDLDKARNWLYNKLKSIKPSNWKPSKEQMEIVENLLACEMPPRHKKIFESLYNDLKNL